MKVHFWARLVRSEQPPPTFNLCVTQDASTLANSLELPRDTIFKAAATGGNHNRDFCFRVLYPAGEVGVVISSHEVARGDREAALVVDRALDFDARAELLRLAAVGGRVPPAGAQATSSLPSKLKSATVHASGGCQFARSLVQTVGFPVAGAVARIEQDHRGLALIVSDDISCFGPHCRQVGDLDIHRATTAPCSGAHRFASGWCTVGPKHGYRTTAVQCRQRDRDGDRRSNRPSALSCFQVLTCRSGGSKRPLLQQGNIRDTSKRRPCSLAAMSNFLSLLKSLP